MLATLPPKVTERGDIFKARSLCRRNYRFKQAQFDDTNKYLIEQSKVSHFR
jgi:hypothetical protein